MPVRPLVFNGATIYRPGYYAKRNIEAGGKVGGVPLGTYLIIAKAEGGVPYNADIPEEERLMYFTESGEARRVLRGGDALEAALIAFNASTDIRINGGASEVAVLRVNPATRSTKNLKNSGAANVILLQSEDYGLHTTGIAVSVSNGSSSGKLVQVRKDGETIAQDNVERVVLSVSYTGNGTAASLTKTATAITTALTGASDGSANLNIDFTVHDNINKIVDYINAQIGYAAVLINSEFGESDPKQLDVVAAADIKTAPYVLKADVQSVIDFINTTLQAVATIVSETERTNVANTVGFEYMTGGAEGTTTVNDWALAFELAMKQDVDIVGAMSGSSSIHALLQSHLNESNSTKIRKERRGTTGCDLTDTTDSAIQAKSKICNSAFIGFWGGNDYRFDSKGVLRQMPGYLLSAGIGGMSAGNDPAVPLTHKAFNIVKTAKIYSQKQVEDFIKAGCMIATPITGGGGFKVERQITTYQGANLIANEWSMMGTILAIVKNHRSKLEARFVGTAGTPIAFTSLESYSIDVLNELKDRGWFTENPATGEVAISNHVVKIVGDVFEIKYDGIVTAPINFIPTTHNFTVIGAK